jgi:hypothetical protein
MPEEIEQPQVPSFFPEWEFGAQPEPQPEPETFTNDEEPQIDMQNEVDEGRYWREFIFPGLWENISNGASSFFRFPGYSDSGVQ